MTTPSNILFVETGIVGGGSFESLYQTVNSLDRSRYTPIVVFLNRTHYLEKMRDIGVKTYLLTDLAYTKSLPKFIHGNIEKRADRALFDHPNWGMKLFRIYHGPLIRSLRNIVRKHNIDLLYLNDQINRDLFGCLVAKDCGIPLISHQRSMNGNSFSVEKCNLANETVSAYISNSTPTKKYWESKGIAKDKHHLLFNAVPQSSNAPLDLHSHFSLPKDRGVIGCVARLVEWKNHSMLLNAFNLLTEKAENVTLLLLGDGKEKDKLQLQAKQLGINDKVIFAGFRTEAREMMADMRMLVLPSHGEPFGRVLIEAMQVGTPVIGSDSGGIVDIIKDGYNGLLPSPDSPEDWAEAMRKLLEDKELRERFKANALETVAQKFDLEKQTERIQEIIDSVLS